MSSISRLYRICYSIALVAVLIVLPVKANSWRVVENDINNPPSLPSKKTMRFIGFLTISINGKLAGGMAVYMMLPQKFPAIMRKSITPKGTCWLFYGLIDLEFCEVRSIGALFKTNMR